MSVYTIQIDDKEVEKQISNILDTMFHHEMSERCSSSRSAIADFIKDVIYAHKDEIIDRIIDKATVELVKKGLPKVLERMTKDGI